MRGGKKYPFLYGVDRAVSGCLALISDSRILCARRHITPDLGRIGGGKGRQHTEGT